MDDDDGDDAHDAPESHYMDDNKAVAVVDDDDPNQMAFFPSVDEPPKPGDRLVLLPKVPAGMPVVSAAKPDDPLVAAMRALPFSSTAKPSLRGLPMRIRWELWVQCMGWKASDTSLPPLYAHLELGIDGHYHSLRTPEGPAQQHSFAGGEAGLPRDKFYVYHHRTDMLRLELRRALDDVCVGYSLFKLRDLLALSPLCGWIKIKDPERRSPVDKHRITIGSVHVGLLLSPPMKAQTLFLMDLQTRDVHFYQGVETLEDLNPVFLTPSMTPFRWTTDASGQSIAVYRDKTVVVLLTARIAQANTRVVHIASCGRDDEDYWQCSVTYEANERTTFAVEGSWTGKVVASNPHKRCVVMNADGVAVAHSEQRNARDVKLSVDSPTDDPLIMICLLLASTFTL